MAKIIRDNPISSTVSDSEKKELEVLDKIIDKSRAEFIRVAVMAAARKVILKSNSCKT